MSVTFSISGEPANYDSTGESANYLNLANSNAADLLAWLGYELPRDGDLSGMLAPGDLRARCVRRLASTPANVAADLPRAMIERTGGRGALWITAGRDTGYLRDKTAALLALAVRAGDRAIEYA